MPAEDIEGDFPLLKSGGYQITSPSTTDYNCFAWALARSDVWYSPVAVGGYYWPENLAMNTDPATMIELFRREGGFEPCAHGALEDGFEKIALYSNSNVVTHAARQILSGAWTSKLGSMEDIEHDSVELLEDLAPENYGKATLFLKRRRG
jgi:hypothetical protein